jgi:two-component sensor histidine kinase
MGHPLTVTAGGNMHTAISRFGTAFDRLATLPLPGTPSAADETNHRVANNLQMLWALTAMEARSIADPAAIALLERTQQSIMAIAGVHRHLYSAAGSSMLDLGSYLVELGNGIALAWPDHRHLVVDATSVRVDASTASSIGVLTAELATNACKHAFEADMPGSVFVSLRRLGTGAYEFAVEDNGRGLGQKAAHAGLGHRVIDAAVANLGAFSTWSDAQPGTRFCMTIDL